MAQLIYMQEGQTALMVAVKEGHKKTVEAFLQEKCDLNIQEKVSSCPSEQQNIDDDVVISM